MGGSDDTRSEEPEEAARSRLRATRHQRWEEGRTDLKRIFSPGQDDRPAEHGGTGVDEGAGMGDTAVIGAMRDTAVLEVDAIVRRSGSHEKTEAVLTEADIDAAVEASLRATHRHDPPLAALGRGLSNALVEMGEMVLLGGQVIKSAVAHPRGYWHEVRDDMYDALKLCWVPLVFAVMGFGFGAPGLQGGNLLYLFGVPDRLGGFFMFATIREFGPFVEAMVVAGVIGTAITADLGARRIREEIDAMEVLGVEPVRNLIVPRVISTALITMLFDLFALVLGILSGFVAAVGFLGSTPSGYVASFFSESNIVDDWTSLAKTLLFGLVIGVVCCYKGYRAKGGPAGVGRAVNQAVVISFAMIWVIDYTFTNIMLGYSPSVQVIK